ncbi:c-type cytochrome domain-containing protein [Roseivirga sp.]|uniref:c-type cytochrome domain-containing protein n=1 Tax=Roseivirga sp. TaxID=1964215 RepID=UPI003B8CF40A
MSLKKGLNISLLAGNALLSLLYLVPFAEPPVFFQFVGRLHPLLLHFPLVLLLVAFIFEIYGKRKPNWKEPAEFLLIAGAATAYVSALAGFLLSSGANYSGQTFELHKWLGLTMSWLATIIYTGKSYLASKNYYLPLFGVACLVIIVTGHYGASLTHGESFLTEVFDEEKVMTLEPTAPVFAQVVQPLLKSKCESCHNPNKLKGSLSLASRDDMLKGGETGAIFIPGDLENSILISHLLLPSEDKKHMPPKGKPQMTNEEVKMLSWWVENGASFEQLVNEVPADDAIQATLASYFAPEEEIDIDYVSANEIAELNTTKISVKQIEEDKPYLEVYIGQHDSLSVTEMKSLRGIRAQIYTLDLGSSNVDKAILKEVAKYENLNRLYLDNTEVDDDMISAIKKLNNLDYLNLYGTKVSKKGAGQMLKLDNLSKIFLWKSAVTEEDVETLQIDFPDIAINGGLSTDSDFTKAELNAPQMVYESTFFSDEMIIEVPYSLSETEIYYQLGSEDPQLLKTKEIRLTRSTKLSVFAKKEGWEDSPRTEQAFIKVKPNSLAAKSLQFGPKRSYKAKGIETLFDLTKGSENFRDGQWLGFNGDDMVANVTLSEKRTLESVFISTMDDTGSWIFPPTALEVWGGTEANGLVKLQTLEITPPEGPGPKHMLIHQLAFPAKEIKYLRVIAKNYGNLPEWHPGKDTPAWLFIDEIAFQ